MEKPRTQETLILAQGFIGDFFYTEKNPSNMIFLADRYGREVKTKKVKIIEGDEMKLMFKVTITK